MAVMAVTGDIGAGKSTASGIFARLMGCDTVDADVVTSELWERGDVKSIAVSRWGSGILDTHGNIIRQEVAGHIFGDEEEHKFCNALIHPLVMARLQEITRTLDTAVLEIPLLPEAGRPEWVDDVVYVSADFSVRAERCRVSRGWSNDELLRREKFLLPHEARMAMCDYVIRNESSLQELERQAVICIQENNT